MVSSLAAPAATKRETKRILLVETSEPEAACRLAGELPQDRFQVTVASEPDQALALVAAGTDYDMALIELDLPRRSSSMTLLRTLRRELPRTPVVMFTDYGDEELWVDVLNEGASDLLSRCDLRRDLIERF